MIVVTTGQVGKLCRVSPRTVAGWYDNGILKGWRVPATTPVGKRDRRFRLDVVRAFMEEYRMPLDLLEAFEREQAANGNNA